MVIYFLCTGNSCRSQMAEGFARHLAKSGVHVESAGIEVHGLNPRAVQAMAEVGIDISQHQSKLIDYARLRKADFVITLCGDARDHCPITPPEVTRLHWGFEDPARAQGTDEEIMAAFRRVRDGIKDEIKRFLSAQNVLRPDAN